MCGLLARMLAVTGVPLVADKTRQAPRDGFTASCAILPAGEQLTLKPGIAPLRKPGRVHQTANEQLKHKSAVPPSDPGIRLHTPVMLGLGEIRNGLLRIVRVDWLFIGAINNGL